MKISIIGLGYVGLPLAVEFSKLYETVGYDVNEKRVSEIKASIDINGDIEGGILSNLNAKITDSVDDISDSDVYIITVPTPIDDTNIPDLSYLKEASKTVGIALKSRSKRELSNKNKMPIVVKADGLAAGKGVSICNTKEDAILKAKEIISGKFKVVWLTFIVAMTY